MRIAELCYELYKIDWEKRISPETKMNAWKDYYQNDEGSDVYDFEDEYLFNVGYDGESYVDFNEFAKNEYLNTKYIYNLLNNKELIDDYNDDIENWNSNNIATFFHTDDPVDEEANGLITVGSISVASCSKETKEILPNILREHGFVVAFDRNPNFSDFAKVLKWDK